MKLGPILACVASVFVQHTPIAQMRSMLAMQRCIEKTIGDIENSSNQAATSAEAMMEAVHDKDSQDTE